VAQLPKSRSRQRSLRPEAVESDEREGKEERHLRLQVGQTDPTVGAHREHRATHERGEAVAAHAPDEELGAEPRDDHAEQQHGVVAEDGAAEELERRGQRGGQEQVLGERERVGQRMEDRGLEKTRRLVEQRVEEERRLIAHELHDEFGQSVTAIRSLAMAIVTQSQNAHLSDAAQLISDEAGRLYDAIESGVADLD